ncbi:MAG: hypothetical protein ACXVA9_04095 [Bdellovibrionales bacterium]
MAMKNLMAAAALTMVTVACVTANKNLDAKLSQETEVQNRAGLQKEATDIIQSSKELTETQKSKLLALRDATRKQMDEIQTDSVKLRAVLIQDVLSHKYNPKEVRVIKSRMAKLDSKRTSVIFEAVEKANNILGRSDLPKEDFMMMNLIDYDAQRGIY